MRILVGTDFSPAANRAVQSATAWAKREHAALRLVHVVPPKRWLTGLWRADLATVSAAHRQAGVALKELADRLDPARELDVSTGIISGRASSALADVARDFRADVMVVGARGEHAAGTRQRSLGGSALKLLATTPIPLLLVRRAQTDPPASVTAAVDLSAVSGAVLGWACRCAARGARIEAFHAYEAPFSARLNAYGISKGAVDLYAREEQVERERSLSSLVATACGDSKVRRLVARGNPVDCLFERIRELEPDLIVVGKHSRTPRTPAVTPYGSVCQHVSLFAPGDVLVVPPSSSRFRLFRRK